MLRSQAMVAPSGTLDIGIGGISLRSRLRVFAPSASADGLPSHLRTVIEGINKELDERVFEPMLEDPRSAEQAIRSLKLFAELWPALLSALGPWLTEHPDRASRMGKAASDAWLSTDIQMSSEAQTRFAGAQKARVELAGLLADDPELAESIGRDGPEIGESCVVADFAILFGMHLMHSTRSLPAEIADDASRVAHYHALNAYTLAAKPTTREALHNLTAEIRSVSMGIRERTRELIALAAQYQKKRRARR